MRRTRHLALPVRSWQYVGLLIVSLACVTFGHVARDKEGKHGSLAGPELQHIAPHNVDACPNTNPYTEPPPRDSTTMENNEPSSSINENEIENLVQNTRISAENNKHRSRSRFLGMISSNRRSSQLSRDDSRRYLARENSRISRSREEEARSRSARSRSSSSLDRSRFERIQVQRFGRTRKIEKSRLPIPEARRMLDSRRTARSVDVNRAIGDNRRNDDIRKGFLRENRSILESAKNYSAPKMMHFETLKQALIITLCAVYGTSMFKGKHSFIRNFPEWMRLSVA